MFQYKLESRASQKPAVKVEERKQDGKRKSTEKKSGSGKLLTVSVTATSALNLHETVRVVLVHVYFYPYLIYHVKN